LGGLIKYAIKHKDGEATLNDLAIACAATKELVRFGLSYWEAKGALVVDDVEDEVIFKFAKNDSNPAAVEIYKTLINDSMEESLAYRAYFKTGELQNYISGGKISTKI
jgi:hypothetical protein